MLFAQQTGQKLTRQEKKDLKKVKAEAAFEEAKQAIIDEVFVLEANTILDSYGEASNVSSNLNFLLMVDEKLYIQLTNSGQIMPLANAIGGFTLKTFPSAYEVTEDKKGNIKVKIITTGNSGSYVIWITLFKGSRTASAEVSQTGTGSNLKFKGSIS